MPPQSADAADNGRAGGGDEGEGVGDAGEHGG